MEDFEERLKVLEEQAARPAERNYNFFRPVGQFIDHVDTINFRMDGDGNFHFGMVDNVSTSKSANKSERRVDSESLSRALKRCKAFIWGNAAYGIIFCVCRDLYHCANNASNFERMLAKAGIEIPDGTINNAISRNSWMKHHIEKWEQHNVMERVLKLRDIFIQEMEKE